MLCYRKDKVKDKDRAEVEVRVKEDKAGEVVVEVVAWAVDVDQVETAYVPIVEKRFPMKEVFHVLK